MDHASITYQLIKNGAYHTQ